MTTETARERAGDVAGSAREQAGGVAQAAREQAGDVAQHARAQARDLMQELRGSVQEQTRSQRQKTAEMLGGFEQELQQMADQGGGSGPATELVRQAAQQCRSWREYLEGPGDALGDLRAFARRRPGTFLLAAAVAGVFAGRMTRGAAAQGEGPAHRGEHEHRGAYRGERRELGEYQGEHEERGEPASVGARYPAGGQQPSAEPYAGMPPAAPPAGGPTGGPGRSGGEKGPRGGT